MPGAVVASSNLSVDPINIYGTIYVHSNGDVASVIANRVQPMSGPSPWSSAVIFESLLPPWKKFGNLTVTVAHKSVALYSCITPVMSGGFSPADEQYEAVSENMRTGIEEETMNDMMDMSWSPAFGNSRSIVAINIC